MRASSQMVPLRSWEQASATSRLILDRDDLDERIGPVSDASCSTAALAAGCTAIVVKPYRPAELTSVIGDLLDGLRGTELGSQP